MDNPVKLEIEEAIDFHEIFSNAISRSAKSSSTKADSQRSL